MLEVGAALRTVLDHARPLAALTATPVLGRVLGEDLRADLDSPPFAKALMDGYAVRSADMTAGEGTFIVLEEVRDRVRVTYKDREWVFPRGDCILLPIENTTAELLARYIAERLLAILRERHGFVPRALHVEVEENIGQSATYSWFATPS